VLARDQWKAYDCGDDPCAWGATAWAKATAGTPFDFYVSLFHGGMPPDGYTAVPA
jgi:hypothetical protein